MVKKQIKKTEAKKAATKKAPSNNFVAENAALTAQPVFKKEKNAFEKNFGEGTAFDLDYGKLLIIALCIYIAVNVS